MASARINLLLQKFFDQSITAAEKEELFKAVDESGDDSLGDLLASAWEQQLALQEMPAAMSARIQAAIFDAPDKVGELPRSRRLVWMKWAVAASVLIAVVMTTYFTRQEQRQDLGKVAVPLRPLQTQPAGHNKAVLTLGDGSEILLDDASKGVLAQDGNATVDKLADGSIRYRAGRSEAPIVYNSIKTPHGGQYEISLPDGSKVWLNAVSTLRFPTSFSTKERRVQISGEAYFEVSSAYNASKQKVPFIVEVLSAKGKSEVEVLGTRFNIKAYDEEDLTSTSLLEGSVRISKGGASRLMVPGQQARFGRDERILLNNAVNMDEVMAWKNGYFQYEDADLRTVLHDAARWYNLDIQFAGPVPTDRFTGRIPRNVSIDRLIKWMAWSDVAVTINGRVLTVK